MPRKPFTVTAEGSAFKKAWKTLRPMRPEKKRISLTNVTFWAQSADRVFMALPGGEVAISGATATGSPCSVLVPFAHIAYLMTKELHADDSVTFQFESGSMTVGGVATKDVRICLRAIEGGPVSAAPLPTVERPIDMLEEQPQGYIYTHFRFIAPKGATPRSVHLINAFADARSRITRAAHALKPLGITKDDIEAILKARYAHGRS
jgi:hypothetical protein